ncbi:hypothetical protein V5R22_01440 [Bacillus thuringiensis]|uniref:Uncharacterized protein n=1 Tax=Bacillus thuringiensis TaxID=1428 RepID=A0A9X6KTV2_BACTU|nr:hypothetical protein [Bacillus thuringiensis]MEB9462310.1 hypothetical protein [Bacillus cereus]ETE93776.1 hypothetical protein C623_0224880 [Bacillus thuringiensis serovar aizawai str. Hu4-2]MDR5039798.1 hypothetical protein [Bacillus thuringiensis]MEC0029349.1 hypothetical protein [Bacillus cereus]MEC2915528.1 hypothetical protein [Bacillus cereus]
MSKFFSIFGFIVLMLLALSSMGDLLQQTGLTNEMAIQEVVAGIFAPLRKWYIGVPVVICLLGFNTSVLYRMLNGHSEKNNTFLMMFALTGCMVYMAGAISIAILDVIV